MDPLSDVIALLHPHAVVSKPITGRGAWGVRYDAHPLPSFCIILAGRCVLAMKGAGPLALEQGDFVLMPATPAFSLVSHDGVPVRVGTPSAEGVHHGETDGPPDFRMLGGTFSIDPINAGLLAGLLPDLVHIRAVTASTDRLAGVIGLIVDECGDDRPGREMILQRLLEIMLVESLRRQDDRDAIPPGLLAGMRDPALAAALRTIHADVKAPWSVAELAERSAMSRSAFAARFASVVGCPPMEYLTRWRMHLAQDALARGRLPLDRLAEQIGYESASAFSTAFRRRIGCAPGAFARARRHADI